MDQQLSVFWLGPLWQWCLAGLGLGVFSGTFVLHQRLLNALILERRRMRPWLIKHLGYTHGVAEVEKERLSAKGKGLLVFYGSYIVGGVIFVGSRMALQFGLWLDYYLREVTLNRVLAIGIIFGLSSLLAVFVPFQFLKKWVETLPIEPSDQTTH